MALQFQQIADDRGWDTLWVGFPERTDCPHYWAWVQICRQLAELGFGEKADELVQHLSRRTGDSIDCSIDRTRTWLFEHVFELLRAASHARRLAIFIDDLQSTDTASGVLLELLVNNLAKLPVLVVATCRETEVYRSAVAKRVIGAVAASPLSKCMTLSGMDLTETAHFTHTLSGWIPKADLVRRLHQQTEGNPLFLHHIVRSLIDQGHISAGQASLPSHIIVPEGIRDAISLRLDRASPDCLALLQTAAILGRNFMIPILEKTTPNYSIELVDEAEALGILLPSNAALGRWQFTHSLIAEVLYERVPPMQRIRMHADAANAIEQLFGIDDSESLVAVAYHSFEGQLFIGTQRVIELTCKAGRHAMSVTAYEDAVRQFKLALDCYSVPNVGNVETRIDLILELAEAHRRAGDILAATECCRQALARSRRINDWKRYIEAALQFEAARWQPGLPSQESLEHLLMALDHSGHEDSPNKARLHYSLARAFQWDGRMRESRMHGTLGVAMARQIGDSKLLCDAIEHFVSSHSHRWEMFDELVDLASEQMEIARSIGDRHRIAKAILSIGTPLRLMGPLERLTALNYEFENLARELAEPHFHYVAAQMAANRAFLDGDFQRFAITAAQALRIGRSISGARVESLYGIQMFLINRERGTLKPFADQAIREHERGVTPFWRPGLALLFAEAGNLSEAARVLIEFDREGLDRIPRDELWLITMGFLGEACVLVGDRLLASRIYEMLVPAARLLMACGPGPAACFGLVDGMLARLSSCMRAFEKGNDWFESAIKQARDWKSSVIFLRISCDYADSLIEEGTPAALKRARELDRSISRDTSLPGLRSLAERHDGVSQKLLHLAASHGFDELTAREVEVLRELAKGSSNAQISHDLGISHATVATHVRQILAKTDCRNRTSAAAYARQKGLLAVDF